MNNPLYQAETAVLGSLILDPDLMDDCYVQPNEMIADERHALILDYLKFSYDQDGTIDLILMAQRSGAKMMRMGGVSYLTELAQSVPTTAYFSKYQSIIRNAYIQRRSSDTLESLAITGRAEGIDIKEHLHRAQAEIEELTELAPKEKGSGLVKMSSLLNGKDHVNEIKERKNKRGLTGARTLSKKMDEMGGGHQKGDLEIIAARPSMGKTAAMNCDAYNTVKDGVTAPAIFSAEMKGIKVTERMICMIANLDNNKMRSGMFDDTDWQKYTHACDELERLPIYIDETPGMTLQHIRREVKQLIKIHPNLIVYIDYLQLIGAGIPFKDKRLEIEYVSRSLKLMARQFNITVVALAQLSRELEKRPDKRPMMSDIREAGGIEQDADVITFLYRDDYYNADSDRKGIVELIIAKGRDIGTGKIEMAFLKQFGKFADLDHTHFKKKEDENGKKSAGQNQQRR